MSSELHLQASRVELMTRVRMLMITRVLARLLDCCSGGALHASLFRKRVEENLKPKSAFTSREFVIADDRELKSTTDIGVIARGTVLAGPSTHIAQSPATMHLDAVNSTIDPVSVQSLWRWQQQQWLATAPMVVLLICTCDSVSPVF